MMKKRKWILGAGMIVVFGVIAMIIGNGIVSSRNSFWEKEPEIRLFREFNVIEDDELAKTVLDENTTEIKESPEVLKSLEPLKNDIAEFFNEKYGIDVSKKLNELDKVYIYTASSYNGERLNGYIDGNTVYLNREILSDDLLKESVFMHEAIHYLGFKNDENSDDVRYIIEGIAEALTKQCIVYHNKEYISNVYEMQRALMEQILIADPNFVVDTINSEECLIAERLNSRLAGIHQSFNQEGNIAENLEFCISSVYYGTAGEEEWLIKLQAQDIVANYCKTFNPEKQQIKRIRSEYIIENFEKVEVALSGEKLIVQY